MTPSSTPHNAGRAPWMVLGAALVFGVLVAASYPCTAAFSSIASAAPVAVDCDPAARPIIL